MSSTQLQEKTFQKILALCDITEKMVLAIQAPNVRNKKELLEIVTPVVAKVDEAVKVVTEVFIEHVQNNEKPDKKRSQAVDTAMKGIYDALYGLKEKGELIAERLQKEAKNA